MLVCTGGLRRGRLLLLRGLRRGIRTDALDGHPGPVQAVDMSVTYSPRVLARTLAMLSRTHVPRRHP
ncbi:hypothetical protein [Streptomyces sp. R08]|uniref:Uncharacterized protein n=1 Tax=Streptomyces sp. R08 TaxID=3238624 RepID=A0AB39MRR7_9ACTN